MATRPDLKSPSPALPSTFTSLGLSGAEVQQRLAQYGPNVIEEKTITLWRQIIVKFWAPVPWMLEAVIVLQMVLGRHLEALVIAVLLVFKYSAGFSAGEACQGRAGASAQDPACERPYAAR